MQKHLWLSHSLQIGETTFNFLSFSKILQHCFPSKSQGTFFNQTLTPDFQFGEASSFPRKTQILADIIFEAHNKP